MHDGCLQHVRGSEVGIGMQASMGVGGEMQ